MESDKGCENFKQFVPLFSLIGSSKEDDSKISILYNKMYTVTLVFSQLKPFKPNEIKILNS